MPVDTPPSASDSSGDVNLEPSLSDIPEHGGTGADHLQRTRAELRSILQLVFGKSQRALDVVIHEQGGPRIVWGGLDRSGYKNFRELLTDLVNSVTVFHAKLAARENVISDAVIISKEELEQTFRDILNAAFASHGTHLQSILAGLKAHKTV